MIDPWIAPKEAKIPDFIIAGGMKCGTTTLHHILNDHPDVFIPDSEIHFFDMDDPIEHPEFNFFIDNEWIYPDIEDNADKYWKWYSDFFSKAKENHIIGEDSTGYLSSKRAPERIAKLKKNIKIIILLRNPIDRTYSHYWHNFRAGRIGYSFEETLRFYPATILIRSLYIDQIKRYFNHFNKNELKIVLFEDLIRNKKKILKDICSYINIDYSKLPEKSFSKHLNKARLPKFKRLQSLNNKLNRDSGNWLYRSHFPHYKKKIGKRRFVPRLLKNVHYSVNPLIEKKPPKMKPQTRNFLKKYFKKELDGLNNLIEKNAFELWFE